MAIADIMTVCGFFIHASTYKLRRLIFMAAILHSLFGFHHLHASSRDLVTGVFAHAGGNSKAYFQEEFD